LALSDLMVHGDSSYVKPQMRLYGVSVVLTRFLHSSKSRILNGKEVLKSPVGRDKMKKGFIIEKTTKIYDLTPHLLELKIGDVLKVERHGKNDTRVFERIK